MVTKKEAISSARELGKRQAEIILDYESLPKIHGWVARDEDGCLMLTTHPPIREGNYWGIDPEYWEAFQLSKDLFPEITWESEPVEVELIIRKV